MYFSGNKLLQQHHMLIAHAAAAFMHHCENKANSAQLELGFGLSLVVSKVPCKAV